jgi:hypothetical protein
MASSSFLDHEILFWVTAVSLIMFFGTLLLIPFLAQRIPTDYFSDQRHRPLKNRLHPALHLVIVILKNTLGLLFIIIGIPMLILPGQGLLTLTIGLLLLDFPGKYRLERWLIRQDAVYRTINWLRVHGKQPPLQIEPREK